MSAVMKVFYKLQKLVEKADPEVVRNELPKLFTERNLARESMARRIGAFMEWRKRGGFTLERIHSEGVDHLEVEFQFPVSQDVWRLRILLDELGSGLIDEMLMGRSALPQLNTGRSEEDITQEFLDYIEDLERHDLFSGAVLIGRHDRILGCRAAGFANREFNVANTVETRFNVASLTKSWTAVAAARLIEDGLLDFNSTLSEIIEINGSKIDPRIEVRHLMSHTSGLGDYFGASFNNTPKNDIRCLDDFLALATNFDPTFTPGTDWSYSNIGMILLGKVIERVCDSSYYEALDNLVFKPAGMNSAFFPNLDEVNKNCANGYGQRWTDVGPIAINTLHTWAVRGAPDGCAFASLADIWAFVQALNSGSMVTADMVHQMTTAKPELGSPDYGYGFAVMPERAITGHSGGLIGASANLDMINAPEGWTVVVLANDLSMRTPVIKARQLIGVTVQEQDDARTNMPRAGLTAR